ncbi:MAG: cell division protein ZapA [Treponema sp.]|nr:cell division protein ZapA [Spirochaetia bacterium]MDD7014525.1 cell division protein ZapA [Spirochaetales bacterium]MDY4901474.1 cell division protein ZapA [Treponema sp.]
MGKIQVDVLGTSFTIQANEDETYLKRLLDYYRQITKTVQQNGILKDSLQVSILAGITLIDELYKEKENKASFKKTLTEKSNAEIETEKITLDLIEKIDSVL